MPIDDMVIALMGPTGTGKSTFIQALTGKDIGVNHGLDSGTTTVGVTPWPHPDGSGRRLYLVDTPGFDGLERSEPEVLKEITSTLAKHFPNQITLSGILFFHRISDNRMGGNSLKSLKSFQTLTGDGSLGNVILVTTMWDLVEPHIGQGREDALRTTFWRPMLGRGSGLARFLNTHQSAVDIINSLQGRQPVADQQARAPAESRRGHIPIISRLGELVAGLKQIFAGGLRHKTSRPPGRMQHVTSTPSTSRQATDGNPRSVKIRPAFFKHRLRNLPSPTSAAPSLEALTFPSFPLSFSD